MRALVLSCGPSLALFDGNTAGYDLVIGVNEVVSRFPVDWWVLADDEVLTRNIHRLAADVRRLFIKRFPPLIGQDPHHNEREREFVLDRTWRLWFDIDLWPRQLLRYSGPSALALAVWRGADEILTYGVDMVGTKDFESDGSHAVRDEPRWKAERFIWNRAVQECEQYGVSVRRAVSYESDGERSQDARSAAHV